MAYYHQINQLSEEIEELQKDDARATEKTAYLREKIIRAQQTICDSFESDVIQDKQKEIERARKDLLSSGDRHEKLSGKILRKNTILTHFQRKQFNETKLLRKIMNNLQQKLLRNRAAYRKRVDKMIRRGAKASIILGPGVRKSEANDFFLCYASGDKEDLVCELTKRLRAKGLRYDEFVLKAGDSLRKKIKHGLANSLYGIVVLSENFLAQEWPEKELKSLISLKAKGDRRIFPVWHRISREKIARRSPILLDRVGLSTSEYMTSEVAEKLMEAKKLRPKRDPGASSS